MRNRRDIVDVVVLSAAWDRIPREEMKVSELSGALSQVGQQTKEILKRAVR